MIEQHQFNLNRQYEQPLFETGEDASMAFAGRVDMYTAQMAAASSRANSYERQADLSRDESKKAEALANAERYRALSTELSRLAFEAGKSAGSRSGY